MAASSQVRRESTRCFRLWDWRTGPASISRLWYEAKAIRAYQANCWSCLISSRAIMPFLVENSFRLLDMCDNEVTGVVSDTGLVRCSTALMLHARAGQDPRRQESQG